MLSGWAGAPSMAGDPHSREVLHMSLEMQPLKEVGVMQSLHGLLSSHTPLVQGTEGLPATESLWSAAPKFHGASCFSQHC